MTVRRILTVCLLLFVAASVATLAGKELRSKPIPAGPSAGFSGNASVSGRQLIACYFLGMVRCSSCRKIEEVARRTVEGSFRRELAAGRLQFLIVNVDLPENRHFVEEFRLESSSLVLVEEVPKLEKYVRDEVAAGLKGI